MKTNKPLSRPDSPRPAGTASAEDGRRPRSDGIEARHRLLDASLRLFAEKGFQKTSTREIAQLAGVNVASIKYYFGDKAGLYRATFIEPMANPEGNVLQARPDMGLHEGLSAFFAEYLAPLQQSDIVQLCLRLHFREMLEPTGVWEEEIDTHIKPAHAAMIQLLQRHLQVKKADDDLHRLAFSIVGLGMQIYISRDIMQAIRPSLVGSVASLDLWAGQLSDQAYAMAAAHAEQRGVKLPPLPIALSRKNKKSSS